jgi:hypothetical protein
VSKTQKATTLKPGSGLSQNLLFLVSEVLNLYYITPNPQFPEMLIPQQKQCLWQHNQQHIRLWKHLMSE